MKLVALICALVVALAGPTLGQTIGSSGTTVNSTPVTLTDGATITVPCPTNTTPVTYYLTLTGNNHQVLFPSCPASSNGQSVKFRIDAGTGPFTGLTFAPGFNWTTGSPYAICTAAATPHPACPAAETVHQIDWFGCDVVGTSSGSTEWDCWTPQYAVASPTSFAFINAASCSAATASPCTTSTTNMTGANLIVVGISYFPGTTPTITDSSSNTYTSAVTASANAGQYVLNCFYKQAPTVTSAMTFSFTGGGFSALSVAGFSGAVSSPLDQTTSGNSGASLVTSQQPGSITPTQNNELIVACLAMGGSAGTTTGEAVGSGYTITGVQHNTAGVTEGGALAYLIQNTATATNTTFSWTTTAYSVAGIMSFK